MEQCRGFGGRTGAADTIVQVIGYPFNEMKDMAFGHVQEHTRDPYGIVFVFLCVSVLDRKTKRGSLMECPRARLRCSPSSSTLAVL